MTLALGKKPARAGAVRLRFGSFVDPALPTPPAVFGPWRGMGGPIPPLGIDWGILGNDKVGNCVWADAAHQTMLWHAGATGTILPFNDKCVLAEYAAETQADDPPGWPTVDGGTDMQHAAAYRSKIGIADATGQRHLSGPYAAVRPGDIDEIVRATYLFGAVSTGLDLPSSALDQFDANAPWIPVANSPREGGHCITAVGRNSRGMILCVTWGRLIGVSPDFLVQYMDEGIAYLSQEHLRDGVSPDGFNAAALAADLEQLRKES